MSIKMVGTRVGVQQSGKAQDKNSFLEIPDDNNCEGVIAFVGSEVREELKLGTKVHFGNQRTTMNFQGKPILVMDQDNIVAIEE